MLKVNNKLLEIYIEILYMKIEIKDKVTTFYNNECIKLINLCKY